MAPILFSIGQFSLPAFGLFLALGFIFATVLIWRQARAWDLDEEKILDLTLLTFFGGLIGARIYFVLTHLNFFLENPIRIFLFNRFPGFSFWGGFILGSAILIFFNKRFKQNIWQTFDIAVLATIAGMVLGNVGCFFGGCAVGVESSSFIASPVVGLVGKRFPAQLIESVVLLIVLGRLWPQAIKFHVFGKVASSGLILVGLLKLILENYRDQKVAGSVFGFEGYLFSFSLIVVGFFIHYKVGKKNLFKDIKNFVFGIGQFTVNSRFRRSVVTNFYKTCYNKLKLTVYNTEVSWKWKLRWINKLLKKAHVKSTPKNISQY